MLSDPQLQSPPPTGNGMEPPHHHRKRGRQQAQQDAPGRAAQAGQQQPQQGAAGRGDRQREDRGEREGRGPLPPRHPAEASALAAAMFATAPPRLHAGATLSQAHSSSPKAGSTSSATPPLPGAPPSPPRFVGTHPADFIPHPASKGYSQHSSLVLSWHGKHMASDVSLPGCDEVAALGRTVIRVS